MWFDLSLGKFYSKHSYSLHEEAGSQRSIRICQCLEYLSCRFIYRSIYLNLSKSRNYCTRDSLHVRLTRRFHEEYGRWLVAFSKV